MKLLSKSNMVQTIKKQFNLWQRDTQLKKLRQQKTREGCPFMGFCPYDEHEPFDCVTCPSK